MRDWPWEGMADHPWRVIKSVLQQSGLRHHIKLQLPLLHLGANFPIPISWSPPNAKEYENRQVGKTKGSQRRTVVMEPEALMGVQGLPSSSPSRGRRERGQGVARKTDCILSQMRMCSAGGKVGGQVVTAPVWVAGPRQPSGGGDKGGYLGGPGGICSSVGEVSMIRTSSRSM